VKQDLLELKFNMNKKMTDYMIEIISIKELLSKLDKDSQEYIQTKEKFENLKKKFIKEFQSINQDEIDAYLRIKLES
jgi:hypothetical protein